MLKVNKIFTDPIQMSKAVEARRERNKRCDDVDNGCYDYNENDNTIWTPLSGEYSKQKYARERAKRIIELYIWIFVIGLLVIGLLN